MTTIIEILNVVVPVFLVIALGYFLGSREFIPKAANNVISRIVFYVAAPSLLFRSAATATVSEVLDLETWGWAALVSVVMAFAVYVMAARSGPPRRGVIAQGVQRSNMVFVGLPVIFNAFGDDVLGPAAVFIGLMVPVYNFLAVILLLLPHQGGQSRVDMWKKTAKGIVTNPLIIGSVGGIIFSALSIPLPLFADRTLEAVGRIAMPLALLSVGADLDFGRLRSDLFTASVVSAMKLLAYPALVYAGLKFLGKEGMMLQFPVLVLASPTAVVSAVMAREMKGDEQLAGAIVIGTTIYSLFTISAWLAFLKFFG